MAWIDVVILALIVVSALLSLFRGFIKEALALASWLAALWVAMVFYKELAGWFSQWIVSPTAQNVTAFSVLFIAVLLLGILINYLAGKLVVKTGLSGTDRMLGVVFGAARGAAIVAILVLLAGITTIPQESWWEESQLVGYFEEFALWMRSYLPSEIADKISYV